MGALVERFPHVREFLADSLTPLGVYRRLARTSPVRFLFESVTGGEQVSRFSFLGAGPREILRLYPDRLEVQRLGELGEGADAGDAVDAGHSDGSKAPRHRSPGPPERLPGEPLAALRRVLAGIAAEPGPIPFTGGFVGFFGYDLIRLVERLPDRPPDPFGLPVATLARFDNLLAFDHAHQRVLAIANEIEGEVSAAAAERALNRLSRLLTAPAAAARSPSPSAGSRPRPAPGPASTAPRSAPPSSAPRSTSPPATSSRWSSPAAGRCPGGCRRWPSIARCG